MQVLGVNPTAPKGGPPIPPGHGRPLIPPRPLALTLTPPPAPPSLVSMSGSPPWLRPCLRRPPAVPSLFLRGHGQQQQQGGSRHPAQAWPVWWGRAHASSTYSTRTCTHTQYTAVCPSCQEHTHTLYKSTHTVHTQYAHSTHRVHKHTIGFGGEAR